MTSAKALEKSKSNGFTLDEHFELAAKIKPLYESAVLVTSHRCARYCMIPLRCQANGKRGKHTEEAECISH